MFNKKGYQQNKKKYSEMESLSYNNITLLQSFYNSIALLLELPDNESSASRKVLREISIYYNKMKTIANESQDPFENKLLITESILSQLKGNFKESIQLLDQAIELSDKGNLYSDKILACELAASFCKSKGFHDIAKDYLQDAETLSRYDEKDNIKIHEHKSSEKSIDTTPEALDLSTVIHSSHVISSEIILEKLFDQLLKILKENAGATNAVLILNRKDDLVIVATGSQNKNEIFDKPIPIDSFEKLPLSIINFIKRSHETVVLNNAPRNGFFTSDPYIVKNQIKSILSYPLLKQSDLRGIMYLENNLTTDAFLPNRVELIKLISAQATISLENALLFEKEREIEMQLQEQFEEIQAQYEEMETMNEELMETSGDLFNANKSLAIYQKFINESAQGMAMTDIHGKLTYGNSVFAQMMGETHANDVLGKELSALYTDEIQQGKIQDLMHEVLSGKEWIGELEIKSSNGTVIPVIQGFFSIKDGRGNLQYIATIITDISEQKRLEEQLIQAQKMEAIGTLAGGIAHDFNNLLTVIIGYSELILYEMDPSSKHNFHVNEIHKAAKTSSAMTNQLLAFSRKQVLVPQILNINHVVNDMISILSRLIGENIKLTTFLMENIHAINADRSKIEQVIMNLVVNARDAMNDGGRIVITTGNKTISKNELDAIPNSKEGSFICLSIEDDGKGMDQATVEKIFEPFFTTKEVGKGTGLGLSVVYGIIAQHNGWINVESNEGKGTIFNLYLPFAEKEKEKENEDEKSKIKISTRGKGQRILLIEDQPEVIRFVNKALSDRGYDVFQATNGREATEIFKERKGEFELIFSDLVLPDTSGLKLIDFFQKYNPDLPIILTSGYSKEMSQWEEIREKGILFIEKPYVLNELLSMVSEIIG